MVKWANGMNRERLVNLAYEYVDQYTGSHDKAYELLGDDYSDEELDPGMLATLTNDQLQQIIDASEEA